MGPEALRVRVGQMAARLSGVSRIDQPVTGLGQLCDGHSASLFDELSHGVQFLGSDGDELPSVVYHSFRERGQRSQVQVRLFIDDIVQLKQNKLPLISTYFFQIILGFCHFRTSVVLDFC